jgi:hypothetical protein
MLTQTQLLYGIVGIVIGSLLGYSVGFVAGILMSSRR